MDLSAAVPDLPPAVAAYVKYLENQVALQQLKREPVLPKPHGDLDDKPVATGSHQNPNFGPGNVQVYALAPLSGHITLTGKVYY